MPSVKNNYLCSFSKFPGIDLATILGLFRVIFPFIAAIILTQILRATLTSSTVTGKSLI